MQNRGIPPSIVEYTIENGEIVNVNETLGTVEYYEPANKIKIVLNKNQEVVTAIRMNRTD